MGYEYQFTITDQDKSNLGRRVDGINSLDLVLRNAPHFISETDRVYSFSDDPTNQDRWASTVFLGEKGFVLCLNLRDAAETELLHYLMSSLLERCGRLTVEDA